MGRYEYRYIQKVGSVMKLPKEGEFITIKSYKHDGSLHRTWRDTMILKTSDQSIIGCNDHTLVTESNGRRWMTREAALLYYHKHFWFNIVAMIRKRGVTYYCNLASPYVVDAEGIKYIDYDLDIKVFPDGEKQLLDVDEYELHSRMYNYPEEIDPIMKYQIQELNRWIDEKKGPFSPEFIDIWYERYCQLTHRKRQ